MKTIETGILDQSGTMIKREISTDPNFLRSTTATYSSYSEKIKEKPYALHSWVYACVKRIVDPVIMLPRALCEIDKDGMQVGDLVYTHPIIEAMSSPNPMMCGSDLWEATLLNLLLPTRNTPGGQCFWVMQTANGERYDLIRDAGKKIIPTYIWPYSDNVIHPRMENGDIVGWKMVVKGQTIESYGIGEILRIRLYNPYNPAQGLSPYSAAFTSVEADSKADEWNTSYYDNSGAIGGVLTTDDPEIENEQLQTLAQVFADSYSGPGNAGRIVALARGLKYDQWMKSNVDMQFIEQQKSTREKIQAAYGVNEEELGIYGKGMNRATAMQADKSVWQKTRLPILQKVWDSLNAKWIRYYDKYQWRGKTDTSGVESLKPVYSQGIDDAIKLIEKAHVPATEALRVTAVPVDTEPYPWLENAYVPMNTIDIEDVGRVEPTESQAKTVNRSIRDDLWNLYVKLLFDPGEKRMKKAIRGLFDKNLDEMVKNIDRLISKETKKDLNAEMLIDFDSLLFDINKANGTLEKLYKGETKKTMEATQKQLKDQYGAAINWVVTAEVISTYVALRDKVLKEINRGTARIARKEMVSIAEKGIDENLTPVELAQEMRQGLAKKMGEMKVWRVDTIARTETAAIVSYSRNDAFEKSGITKQEWLSSRDAKVRTPAKGDLYDHLIDGESVMMGQTFSNNLRYPHDPEGAPGNVINCRCVVIPVIE